jgi:predicted negative regulator of RcsB-dependent stress response
MLQMRRRLPLLLWLVLPAACTSSPDYAAARWQAANLLDDDPQATARYVDELDEELRDDAALTLLRAEAAARSGDLDTAIHLYQPIADRKWAAELVTLARRNLAVVLLQADRPDEAYAVLQKLPEAQLEKTDLQRELGIAALAAGRADAARKHFANLSPAEREQVLAVLGPDFLATR